MVAIAKHLSMVRDSDAYGVCVETHEGGQWEMGPDIS